MNIRRLMATVFAAAALLPLAPAIAQGGSPFDVPTPGFGGGGRSSSEQSTPDQNGNRAGFPAAAPRIDETATSITQGILQEVLQLAARQHPAPPGWSGHSVPAATSLPVSEEPVSVWLYDSEKQGGQAGALRGHVEARIATSQGLFYVLDTDHGSQVIPARAITFFFARGHLLYPGRTIPVPGPHFFAGENERMLAAQERATRANWAAADRQAARERASATRQAHLRAAAENRALHTYANAYPGWTSGRRSPPAFTRSSVRGMAPDSGGGFAAGPGDSGGHDYARAIGDASDPVLSTGWTSGHGSRTQHVRDYYRHTKSGELVHVHSYFRRPR